MPIPPSTSPTSRPSWETISLPSRSLLQDKCRAPAPGEKCAPYLVLIRNAWYNRPKGVGSALLQALLQEAVSAGLSRVFLHAQTSAVDFYTRHGFTSRGEEFMDAGIPHYYMERDLGT